MMNWLVGLWRRQLGGCDQINIVRYYTSRASLPARLSPDELIVIGEPDRAKWVIFECPCGDGHRIELNLQVNGRPRWDLTMKNGRPTLFPSVDSRGEHRCHFTLNSGQVHWVDKRRGRFRRRAVRRSRRG